MDNKYFRKEAYFFCFVKYSKKPGSEQKGFFPFFPQGRRKSQDVGTNTKSEQQQRLGVVNGNPEQQQQQPLETATKAESKVKGKTKQQKKKKIAKSLNSVGGSDESVTESTSDFQTERYVSTIAIISCI